MPERTARTSPLQPGRRRSLAALVLSVVVVAAPACAVEPDEMLANPVLEARARSISSGLRCLICQNQSIDDSSAPLARDLRLLVRERLTAGDSDAGIERFLVQRYGEFVLLKPRFGLATALLWLTPLLLLAAVGTTLWRQSRRQSLASPAVDTTRPLDAEEQQRLDTILARPTDRA